MPDKTQPIRLVEDEATGDRFLVYSTEKGLKIDIRFQGEDLWMTQAQIAELFGVDRSVVTKHVSSVYSDGELDAEGTSAKIAQVRQEGIRTVTRTIEHYNLDVVISVGYRVSSSQATVFRKWSTGILVQYAKRGFVIDAQRLKEPDNIDRVRELREIIRDIRSSEANLYAELKRICAMCQDYDGSDEISRQFFQHTQAKLVYAVTSMTPSELVFNRADHRAENMGLQAWSGDYVRKSDVCTSKNYLGQAEIRELNRLTEILLGIFEDQLDLGRLVTMADARRLLDKQLGDLGRSVLKDGGRVSGEAAKARAGSEYDRFDEERKAKRKAEADASIAALRQTSKDLQRGTTQGKGSR